ncbi:MAG: threonine dehydrogenase-like Zn-dependent dehydrogenase [Candidatus Latescibacterota bacterium]
MRAAHVVAPRQIEMFDADEPNLNDFPKGSIKVKTHMTALCGSDSPWFVLTHPPERYPLNIGISIHECIGTVVESTSDRLKVGDFVQSRPTVGIGGLGEYYISNDSVGVHLVDFEHQDQMLMSQPLGTVIWACRKLGNILNQDTLVLGQGPMGLLMTHLLSNLGARTVIAVDPVDFRLQAAGKMRATHLVNSAKEDVVEAVAKITEGRMADLVVEIVGHNQDTVNLCIKLTKRLGTVLCFGVPDDDVYAFNYGDFFRKNISLIGSVSPDSLHDYPLAMDMIAQRRIDVSPIITHHLPFEEAQKAFELFIDHRDEAIKVVLDY